MTEKKRQIAHSLLTRPFHGAHRSRAQAVRCDGIEARSLRNPRKKTQGQGRLTVPRGHDVRPTASFAKNLIIGDQILRELRMTRPSPSSASHPLHSGIQLPHRKRPKEAELSPAQRYGAGLAITPRARCPAWN